MAWFIINFPKLLISIVQFIATGISDCEQWISSRTADKLIAFSFEVISFIRSRCEFDNLSINQSRFECSEYQQDIYFEATLTWNSEHLLESIINEFRRSNVTFQFEGDILHIQEHPSSTNTHENTDQLHPKSYFSLFWIIGIVTFVIVILTASLVSIIIICKHRRKNATHM